MGNRDAAQSYVKQIQVQNNALANELNKLVVLDESKNDDAQLSKDM